MTLLLPLAVLLASGAAAAEPLQDKIDREYVQPVFRELQGALDGREPAWTPPVLPGSAETAALSEKVRTLWLDPLMAADQRYAFAAARALASPQAFDAPAGPDLAAIVPSSPSPASDDLVSAISRRFLSRLFPADYALAAAGALGSSRADAAGLPEPDVSDLAKTPAKGGARFAKRDDFARTRKVADSTALTRGSASGTPKLKPTESKFSSAP